MARRLIHLHFILVSIALTDLALFHTLRVSLRGQWLDILLSVAPIASALVALFSHWKKRIAWPLRLYFIIFIAGNLLLTPVYFFATIPVRQDVYERLGHYEARQLPGMLGTQYESHILRSNGLFEQQIRGRFDFSPEPDGSRKSRFFRRGDSLYLRVPNAAKTDSLRAICSY